MKVEHKDYWTGDLLVVNAARASFGKESAWERTWETPLFSHHPECVEHLNDKDTKLINYLAEHHHWLPFRHPTETFQCKAPLFVARQCMKHQVGMSWSEESRRYIDSPPEFYTPEVWRKRADNVKQGSSDETAELSLAVVDQAKAAIGEASRAYRWLVAEGVAPEQARMVLPQSMYTTWVWTGSLLAWAHFVKQRTESHAQKEIQEFASLFVPYLEEKYPVSWQTLMRHYEF